MAPALHVTLHLSPGVPLQVLPLIPADISPGSADVPSTLERLNPAARQHFLRHLSEHQLKLDQCRMAFWTRAFGITFVASACAACGTCNM